MLYGKKLSVFFFVTAPCAVRGGWVGGGRSVADVSVFAVFWRLPKIRADCGRHFRAAEFLFHMFGNTQVRGTRVHLNFDVEEHGKGECDGRFNVIKKFIESYTMAQPDGWKWSDSDITSCAKKAIEDGTKRNKGKNAIVLVYDPNVHGLGSVSSKVPNITSSYCFRADCTLEPRKISNCALSSVETGKTMKLPTGYGQVVIGQVGNNGGRPPKKIKLEGARKAGAKTQKKRELLDKSLKEVGSEWAPGISGEMPP